MKYLKKCGENKKLKKRLVRKGEDAKVDPRFFRHTPHAGPGAQLHEGAAEEAMDRRGAGRLRLRVDATKGHKPTTKTLKAPWKKLRLSTGINQHILEVVKRRVEGRAGGGEHLLRHD